MKTKSLFIAAFFTFTLNLSLRAQEVYEFGMVKLITNLTKYEIYTTLNNVATEVKGKLAENENRHHNIAANITLSKLTAEGWEVYNSNGSENDGTGVISHFYYLRRKK